MSKIKQPDEFKYVSKKEMVFENAHLNFVAGSNSPGLAESIDTALDMYKPMYAMIFSGISQEVSFTVHIKPGNPPVFTSEELPPLSNENIIIPPPVNDVPGPASGRHSDNPLLKPSN